MLERFAAVVLVVLMVGCGGGGGADGGTAGGGGPATGGGTAAGGGSTQACVAPGCILLDSGPELLQLELDAQGRPLVLVTVGETDAQRIKVLRLESGQWRQVGEDFPVPQNNTLLSGVARLALAGDAAVLATVTFGASVNTVNVVKEVASAWQPLGPAVPAFKLVALGVDRPGPDARQALVLNVRDAPANVWTYDAAANAFGAQPGALGPLSGAYGTLEGVISAITRDPLDEASLFELNRWSPATGWTRVGAALPVGKDAAVASFAALGPGAVALVTRSTTGTLPLELFALASDGGPWVSLGNPSSFTQFLKASSVAVVGTTPVVAFVESEGVVKGDTMKLAQHKAGIWATVDAQNNDDTALAGAPLLAARGSTVHLAWRVPGFSPGFKLAYRTVVVP